MRIDGQASFVQFLYPFTFDPKEFVTRCNAADATCWSLSRKAKGEQFESVEQVSVWETDRFEKEDLLPHVEHYLNPRPGMGATARLWKLSDRVLQSSDGLGCKTRKTHWQLLFGNSAVDFEVDGIKLSLFCNGVGFVAVCASPKGDTPEEWLDFIYHFRFVQGRGDVSVCITREGWDEAERKVVKLHFFPPPAGGLQAHPDGKGHFGDILKALLQTLDLSPDRARATRAVERLHDIDQEEKEAAEAQATALDDASKRAALQRLRGAKEQRQMAQAELLWWDEPFVPGRMLPFSTLFVDDLPETEKALFLYRARKLFHSRQAAQPAEEDLRFDNQALLCYSQQQWFTFSLDGGSFVAFDAPSLEQGEFFRNTLPAHLRDQYFLLFLLALHQRFALMRLSGRVADHWPLDTNAPGAPDKRETIFRDIRDALLLFAARGHFVQAMQRENHHRCYRKWQETFQVEALYREVSDEVREMHNYLLVERSERVERLQSDQKRIQEEQDRKADERAEQLNRRISFLGIFIGVPALFISFLGINLKGFTSSEGISSVYAFEVGVGGGLLFGAMIALILWWFNKPRS